MVSLEELIESGKDGCLLNGHHSWRVIEKTVELRDIIAALPEDIQHLGQRRVEGYALTNNERKRLERFRKSEQGNKCFRHNKRGPLLRKTAMKKGTT